LVPFCFSRHCLDLFGSLGVGDLDGNRERRANEWIIAIDVTPFCRCAIDRSIIDRSYIVRYSISKLEVRRRASLVCSLLRERREGREAAGKGRKDPPRQPDQKIRVPVCHSDVTFRTFPTFNIYVIYIEGDTRGDRTPLVTVATGRN
jgi:hypothetical protein